MNSVFLLVFVVLSAALAIDIHQLSSEVISLRASKDPVPLLNLHGGWKFDVNFDVRLRHDRWDDANDASQWTIHGVWEPQGSATSRVGRVISYAPAWSDAVKMYNTDLARAHKRLNPLVTVDPATMPAHANPINAVVNDGDHMDGMYAHEYESHGYYLPMSRSQFEAVVLSDAFTNLKTICARHAATILEGIGAGMDRNTHFSHQIYDDDAATSINVKLVSQPAGNNGNRFIDCLAGATVSFKVIPGILATNNLVPTVTLHTAVREGKRLYVRNALWKDKN